MPGIVKWHVQIMARLHPVCAKDQLTVVPHAHILQINSDEEKMIMARKLSCN